MQLKKTAAIVLVTTMMVASYNFNTVSATEAAETVDQVEQIGNNE